ncbi:MAG: GNAT family N-acetyltransferase [Chlorobia bacterium]|nr:GNAT family N-acetyltransferase [Fimbriimonadaceae bacterium]
MVFLVSPPVSDEALNDLYGTAWPKHKPCGFDHVLSRSLAYICAYDGEELVGFVYLAWDGGIHAFVLEPTVRKTHQRRGIGRRLMEEAAKVASEKGIEWLHVDYEPHLEPFYSACGFRSTLAGLRNLRTG